VNKEVDGYKIVLTADRTLMSEYDGGIFLGFSACVPRGLIPDKLYFSLFCPSVETNQDGSVKYAPCGTRKIEAALLDNGFKREDVVVAHPEHLDKVAGSNTKVMVVTDRSILLKSAGVRFEPTERPIRYMSLSKSDIQRFRIARIYSIIFCFIPKFHQHIFN
jgi:hypothetical protein